MIITIILYLLFNLTNGDLYPSSCEGLEDGTYKLKLLDDDNYPVINAKCSNEHIILDYSLDNNLKTYFTSWEEWYYDFVGPENTDFKNWQKWFLPTSTLNDEDTSFMVSPDCNSCDIDSSYQLWTSYSSYYMSGTIFGCQWRRIGSHDCDYYYDSTVSNYVCHSCDDPSNPTVLDDTATSDDYIKGSICPIVIGKSNRFIENSQEYCVRNAYYNMKPSLSTDGHFCTCVKYNQNYYTYDDDDNTDTNNIDDDNDSDDTDDTNNENEKIEIKLYQSDFISGTYRITKPGIYILQENIIFDFNKGDIDDPFTDDSWWPKASQSDDYPGAGNSTPGKNAFFLGFFAGITIESDDVILDLNNYGIEMSKLFYYSQRWFTCIEIGTNYFLPGEGPVGNFGPKPLFPKNILIKDGFIGLSSHHGIHGNSNQNLKLYNLDVSNFETHGIQVNGFTNLEIKNCDIHDSSKIAYLTGEFSHIRGQLSEMHKFALENPDEKVFIKNHNDYTTYPEVIENVEKLMKLVWNYVTKNIKPKIGIDCTLSEWKEALLIFYNPSGYFYGASQYGLFLNTYSASVFVYKINTVLKSKNAIIQNINIYNLNHNMIEKPSLGNLQDNDHPDANSQWLWQNYFGAPYDARFVFGDDWVYNEYDPDDSNIKYDNYIGNAFTDAQVLLTYFGDLQSDINHLGQSEILHPWILDYSKGDFKGEEKIMDKIYLKCNVDAMIHSAKGIIGIRVDAVENIQFNNINIHDLHSYTPLGLEVCGNYADSSGTYNNGEFRVQKPMQKGFSGNNAQGISLVDVKDGYLNNFNIYNIFSETGLSYGIGIWPNTDVKLKGKFNINNIKAGINVEKGTLQTGDVVNFAPDACGILFYDYYQDVSSTGVNTYYSTYEYDENTIFNIDNIDGHVGCLGGDKNILSMIDNNSPLKSTNSDNNDNDETTQMKKKSKKNNLFSMPSTTFVTIFAISNFIFIGLIFYVKYSNNNININKSEYSLINRQQNHNTGSYQTF